MESSHHGNTTTKVPHPQQKDQPGAWRFKNLGKQSFLQAPLPLPPQKKKEEEISFKNVYINLSILAFLFILHGGGPYTLNYLNDEILSHVKILFLSFIRFLYGQNKLLR